MIDTEKYTGHTKGDNEVGWRVSNNFVSNGKCPNYRFIGYIQHNDNGRKEIIEFSDADANLIADAPLLLAEFKQLREKLNAKTALIMDVDKMIGEKWNVSQDDWNELVNKHYGDEEE